MSKTYSMLGLMTAGFTVGIIALLNGADYRVFNFNSQESDDKYVVLQRKLVELEKRQADTKQDVSWLSRTSPPVGTVVAFAGEWPPKKGEGGNWTVDELGWILCNGISLEEARFSELRAVLGSRNAPDYRGYFLRGLDITGQRDKGKLVADGKRQPRTLGSEQSSLTALPTESAFKTGDQSENPKYRRLDFRHSYVFATGNGASASYFDGEVQGGNKPKPEDQYPNRKVEGNHTHVVSSGGDPETRPINVAVHWIIKFK